MKALTSVLTVLLSVTPQPLWPSPLRYVEVDCELLRFDCDRMTSKEISNEDLVGRGVFHMDQLRITCPEIAPQIAKSLQPPPYTAFCAPRRPIADENKVRPFFKRREVREFRPPRSAAKPPISADRREQMEAMVDRVSTIARSRGYRYCFGGDGRKKCFDCSGFTSFAYRIIGVTIPRTARLQCEAGRTIPLGSAQPGYLLCFSRVLGGSVTHVGLLGRNGEVLHSVLTGGLVVHNIKSWRPGRAFQKVFFTKAVKVVN